MSIAAKHAYRFGYLKSEAWKTVRLEALARANGYCNICSARSLSNDAHHFHYPKNIWNTKVDHLVILCRECHRLVHELEENSPRRRFKDDDDKQLRKDRHRWRKIKYTLTPTRRSGDMPSLRKSSDAPGVDAVIH